MDDETDFAEAFVMPTEHNRQNVVIDDINSQPHIKMEFSCETEKLLENYFSIEYSEDDNVNQVEVHSQNMEQPTDEEEEQHVNFLEQLSAISLSEADRNGYCNNNDTSGSETDSDIDINENIELSNVMSDHNYTTQEQEVNNDSNNLKNCLINAILSKNYLPEASGMSTKVMDFVDSILIKVSAFSMPCKEDIVAQDEKKDFGKEDSKFIDSDRDVFAQNILEAFYAEDAADEEDLLCISSQNDIDNKTIPSDLRLTEIQSTNILDKNNKELFTTKNDVDENKVKVSVATEPIIVNEVTSNDVPSTESQLKNKNNNTACNKMNLSTEEILDRDKQKQDADEDILPTEDVFESTDNEQDSEIALEIDKEKDIANLITGSQSYLLPQNCSEPMEHDNGEHISFDEAFEVLGTNNQSEKCLEILEQLQKFSKLMYEDCCSFVKASTDINDKLNVYMKEQFDQFKKITQLNVENVDSSMQTEPRISSRKLKKLNSKNKKVMLASSDSSESDDSSSKSSDEQPLSQDDAVQSQKKHIRRTLSHKRHSSAETELTDAISKGIAPEYDDGVTLTKYIQSEIFEYDASSNQSSISSKIPKSDSDKENGSNENVITTVTTKSTDKLKTIIDEEDENDKEVERLINLDNLTKRQVSSGQTKSIDTEKCRVKSQSQKQKQNIIEFADDEIQKDFASDDSVNESEEEITETQYLARCNQNLKEEFLNGSSCSDSDNNDSSEFSKPFLSDEDENSPLVDKFLRSFNVEDSDTDENNVGSETYAEENDILPISSESNKEKLDKNDEVIPDSKNNIASSTDNSDCELLNDNLLFRKRTRPKSLEKMLAEADKRKKLSKIDEDLISLSSESESTDVEAVDVDETKSRILKPMLRQDQLASETRMAQKHEADRIRRLDRKHSTLTKVLEGQTNKHNEIILDYNEETKTIIKVHPSIVKHLKPHQVEGIKFMYDACYGGLEALKKHNGSGCILAHCMGLGKTLQLIALLHTVISYKELKTTKILVLCPKSTVMNWADEIIRWLGPLNEKNLKIFKFNDTSDINEKLNVLREWSLSSSNKAGCLLIGYEAFRTLIFYHSYKNRGNISTARLEEIRAKVDRYLLKPGADLVVCDEGHIIKNSKSAISLAVTKIITSKRIILTGTPIQNNLKEYYSMVNFIKPLFLGTEKEFANLYANPIKNGQHKDSSKRDIKVMQQRSFVLHKKLSKFVQRKEAELLKSFLPQKFEYVLFIPMTTVQNNLYEFILEAISRREDNRGKSLITDYTCLRKIWTHPKVLENAWKNAITQKYKRDKKANQQTVVHSDDDQPDDIYDSQTGIMSVTNDWWRHLVSEKDLETVLPSNKLRTMFEILRMCEEKGEKCLIFSAFVAVLNVVEYFFKKISDSEQEILSQLQGSQKNNHKKWVLGQDYYRLDGKTPKSIRHEMIKRFNSPLNKQARVFLISSKAGGQGINLIGANRVIILDTSWNPSNDQQNIFRIFRLGQKKNCYIYRLLAMGTMEEKVYSRSVTKQAMSYRVVDEQQIDRHYSMAELAELYTLTIPKLSERSMPVLPQDSILANLLLNYPDLVYKYHEHDSLLENKVEQELSEQEKTDAWAAYERDLQINSEMRELPFFDDKIASPKMPNYLGALQGLDMQTLMNFGRLGQQATSPYIQSLLSQQYSYPATSQQYLDLLNLQSKFAQSALSYPDISTSMADSTFNPSTYPLSSKLLSGLHGSAATNPNPLTALGDLFGMSVPKNLSHSSAATPFSQHQHSPMYTSPLTSTNSNALLSTFGQYKHPLENTFSNLYNYPNNYSISSPVKAKLTSSTSTSQYNNSAPIYSSPAPQIPQTLPAITTNVSEHTYSSTAKTERAKMLQQFEDKTAKKVDNESIPMSVIKKSDTTKNKTSNVNSKNSPIEYTLSNRPSTSTPQISKQSSNQPGKFLQNTATNYEGQRAVNMGISYPKSNGAQNANAANNPNTSSFNMGIIYPNTNVPATASVSELRKISNEMQIIPTTSPPGTSSISKQFSSISPSISLTAVQNANVKTMEIPSQNVPSKHTSNAAPARQNSNLANTINKTITNMIKSKTSNNVRSVQGSSVQPSASVIAKTAAAAAVAAKSVAQNFSNAATLKKPIVKKTVIGTPSNMKSANITTQNKSTKQPTHKTAAKANTLPDSRLSQISFSNTGQKRLSAAPTDKNTLNIRPVTNKQNPSGTGRVYIIETNINEKKLAIGAPTKSGGGTTVTKVSQNKRKAADVFSKERSLDEVKRQK